MLKMKLYGIILSGILLLSITSAGAQDNTPAKTVVLFDPLFWKEDLKLSTGQCQKIKDINFEFFQRIISLSHETRSVVPAKTAELLSDRSEKIWSTFQPRQKKKWKKMWSTES
jgi:hypothetical protein